MKGRRCLVVLETFENCAVYHNLVVLKFSAHHPEGGVDYVMINVDLAEAMT